MKHPSQSRSATALVVAMFVLVVCSGLAVTMIDRATSGMTTSGWAAITG